MAIRKRKKKLSGNRCSTQRYICFIEIICHHELPIGIFTHLNSIHRGPIPPPAKFLIEKSPPQDFQFTRVFRAELRSFLCFFPQKNLGKLSFSGFPFLLETQNTAPHSSPFFPPSSKCVSYVRTCGFATVQQQIRFKFEEFNSVICLVLQHCGRVRTMPHSNDKCYKWITCLYLLNIVLAFIWTHILIFRFSFFGKCVRHQFLLF